MSILKTTILAAAVLTMSACSTTGLTSGVGHANKDLIEAQGRTLNNEAQAIQNMDAATSALFNYVLAQGKLADVAGLPFDPQTTWAQGQIQLNNRTTLSQNLLKEIDRRLAKHNRRGKSDPVWVSF